MSTDDWATAQRLLKSWPTVGTDVPATGTCRRLRDALAARTGRLDVAMLVRQVLLEQEARQGRHWPLEVPLDERLPHESDWRQVCCTAEQTESGWRVTADPWHPYTADGEAEALEDIKDVYRGQQIPRRSIPADPFWTAAVGLDSYLSYGQREAARSVVTAPAGSTTIVCLPTGQGKTQVALSAILPASRQRGVSVIVVPTVILALDLERRVIETITSLGERHSPQVKYAYTGSTDDQVKQAIRRDIQAGTQRLVIASPEAVSTGLSSVLAVTAEAGHLQYLVLDEAHLVDQWGTSFRPEFQTLSAQRMGWLRTAPQGRQVRTIALSATLADQNRATLVDLFGPEESTRLVWAAQTRQEPTYYVQRMGSVNERDEEVINALTRLPKPLVLYVSRRAEARRWVRTLQAAGIYRVTQVTGDTSDDDRKEAILGCRGQDSAGAPAPTKYDIVIGTSAFGLGVDISGVRTVLHACVPETIDRYYQEVGRAGRDGRPSIAYLVSAGKDYPEAEHANSQVLNSSRNGWDRWQTLYTKAVHINGIAELDLRLWPAHLSQPSSKNVQWNVQTLNLMARAKMIKLHPAVRPQRREDEGDDEWLLTLAESHYKICVELCDGQTNTWERWRERSSDQRYRLAAQQKSALMRMHEVIWGKRCVGEILADHYEASWQGGRLRTAVYCRGCPACRHQRVMDPGVTRPDRGGLPPRPPLATWLTSNDPLQAARAEQSWLSIYWSEQQTRDDLLPELITRLVRRGVAVVAGPGLTDHLAQAIQRRAKAMPLIIDRDGDLIEGYAGPVIWVHDDSMLEQHLLARLASTDITYLMHPQSLPAWDRPQTSLVDVCFSPLPIKVALGEL